MAPSTARSSHHEAAERRADHAGDVYTDAVQREGGLELLPGNEARQHSQEGRRLEGGSGLDEEN